MKNSNEVAILTLAEAREKHPMLLGDGVTEWHNPTADRMMIEFSLGPVTRRQFGASIDDDEVRPARACMLHTIVRVPIEPGAKVKLPKIWDRAIHHIDKGAIIGGSAPQLRRAAGQIEKVDRAILSPAAGGPRPMSAYARVIED